MNRPDTFISLSLYLKVFALLCLLATFSGASANTIANEASNQWQVTPEPSWGSQAQLPQKTKGKNRKHRGGKVYHIAESHNLYTDNADETTFYQRYVYQINNASGLDSADPISIEYDPLFQRVEFHQARIHRDGKIIDQLLNGEKVRLLQRETELHKGLYNGHETLHLILDDQRVGDTIEYSFSIVGSNPVFENHIFGWNRLQASVPVGNYYFRLQYPKDKQVHTRQYAGNVPMESVIIDDYQQHTWQNVNTKPSDYQSDVPRYLIASTYIQYSDFSNWQEVAKWAKPLYELPAEASAPIKFKAKEIQKTHRTQKAQIEEVIRFVQDEVRYTGLNSGIGGFVPDSPAAILQRRFGDCKDKASLITALLNEFGVTAYPALVHSYDGPVINTYLPSPDAFDHMIVSLPYNGNTYWIDGTATLQGSTLESLHQGAFDAALVPGQATLGLQEYTTAQAFDSMKSVEEIFHLQNNNNAKPTTLTIKTQLHGSQAEYIRDKLQYEGIYALEQSYLEYYQDKYDETALASEMQVHDDRENNIINITESYLIDAVWTLKNKDTQQHKITLDADDIYYALDYPDDKKRFQSIAQRHPINYKYKITLHDEDGWTINNEVFTVDNQYFSYRSEESVSGNTLTITYSLHTKAAVVSVADSNSYIKDLETMLSDVGYYVSYTPSPASPLGSAFLKFSAMLQQAQTEDTVNSRNDTD